MCPSPFYGIQSEFNLIYLYFIVLHHIILSYKLFIIYSSQANLPVLLEMEFFILETDRVPWHFFMIPIPSPLILLAIFMWLTPVIIEFEKFRRQVIICLPVRFRFSRLTPVT